MAVNAAPTASLRLEVDVGVRGLDPARDQPQLLLGGVLSTFNSNFNL